VRGVERSDFDVHSLWHIAFDPLNELSLHLPVGLHYRDQHHVGPYPLNAKPQLFDFLIAK
jgi:hypothetical protein